MDAKLTLRLEGTTLAAAMAEASHQGLPVSSWVRTLIVEKLGTLELKTCPICNEPQCPYWAQGKVSHAPAS